MQSAEEVRTLRRNSASARCASAAWRLSGAVSQNLEEALNITAFVLQGHHLPAGPEDGTILFLVPALVAATTVNDGGLHLYVRQSLLAVFEREEDASWLAKHLLFSPTKYPVRAFIPRRDKAIEIHGDDGVVDGTLEKGLEKPCTVECHGIVTRAV